MSPGSRSGVNCTRLTEQSIETGQRLGQRGLAHARHVLHQEVALGEQRDEREAHDVRLAHEHVLDVGGDPVGQLGHLGQRHSRRPHRRPGPRDGSLVHPRRGRRPAARRRHPTLLAAPPPEPHPVWQMSGAAMGGPGGRPALSVSRGLRARSPPWGRRPPTVPHLGTGSSRKFTLRVTSMTDCLDREVVRCPAIGWDVGFPHLAPLSADLRKRTSTRRSDVISCG